MSPVMRKPASCICENKGADHRLSFRYIDSTLPLLPNSEMSSFLPSSVAVHASLCLTWSETPKTGFLTTTSSMRLFWELFPSVFHEILCPGYLFKGEHKTDFKFIF